MKQLIAIAISGGIDSLVAAYLLKKQGHSVIGIHFVTGYESAAHDKNKNNNLANPRTVTFPSLKDSALHKISHISDQLGISVKIIDCRKAFKSKIVDYFTQTYQAGKTPNPCLVCNPSIKFGTVLDFALNLGASYLATGHYARITKDNTGIFHLLKGIDPKKDQSYFLSFLSQKMLARAFFPLGSMTKSEVIKLAKEKEFVPFTKSESQDVCFIKSNAYGQFLAMQKGFNAKQGLIEDINGNILGEHKGLHLFTIGQRRGINCPASEPYYVVRIDKEQNRLVVGFKKDLLSSECRIIKINWINQVPTSPIKVYTRLRYRHKAALSTLFPVDRHTAIVRFETPQSALTPGQGAVFYQDDEVLGGGWIE